MASTCRETAVATRSRVHEMARMTTNLPLGPFGCAIPALIGCVALLAVAASTAQAADLPDGFSEDVVFSNLVAPTAVRFAPGPGDDRVFVAEKDGTIQVFDGLDDIEPTQFADLANVYPLSDRGLLGLALDPGFPSEPYVYALYTHDSNPTDGGAPWGDDCPDPPGESTDGCVVTARLSRLTADVDDNVMTDEQVLLDGEWCQQYPSHSIGSLAFGPDGYLYASAGDGASFDFADWGQNGFPDPNPCGDPPGGVGANLTPPTGQGGALRSQDLRTPGDPTGLDGSIIRVDPDNGDPAPDNPNTGPDENAERIVAHGFRNPYRFTVRPGGTGAGELWIGDVGWTEQEEIDVLENPTAGPVKNFGWPCYEGNDRQVQYDAQNLNICEDLYDEEAPTDDPFEHPHYTYEHGVEVVDADDCAEENGAVTSGIEFYETGDYPDEYDGALFFGDYARGCIWTMLPDGSGDPDPGNVQTLVEGAALPVDLQVGPGGDLFYSDYGFGSEEGGTIRRIRYHAPTAVATADVEYGPTPLEVHFDGSQSTEFDGSDGDLTYDWDLDGNGSFETTGESPMKTYTDGSQNVTVRLRVTDTDDGNATDLSEPITISPGNLAPPEVTIDEPSTHATWRVGEDVGFSAQATDLDDPPDDPGAHPVDDLDWTVSIEHCPNGPTGCHVHPLENFLDSGSGSITAPNHEYPSGLIFEVEATDERGLKATDTIKIDAARADLTFRSAPISGVELTVDTVTEETPFTRTVVAGSPHTVEAPASVLGSPAYVFGSWSDGGGRVHGIEAPEGARTYTATYRATGQPGEPPAPPQGSLELRKGERNRKRGTAKLEVEVPGPGRLDLAGKKVKSVTKEVSQAGTVEMPVKPNSKTKKKLKNTGKAKVTVEVTFTPTEGDPASETGSLKLVKKR
jgi:glucose/arabinose dehydrogenase